MVETKHPLERFFLAFIKIIGFGAATEYILYLIEQSYKNSIALYIGFGVGCIISIVTFGWFIWLIFALAELSDRNRNYKLFTPHFLKCYDLAGAAGPVSARQMIEQLKEAENVGIQWPPTLYALLDDIISRTGRF